MATGLSSSAFVVPSEGALVNSDLMGTSEALIVCAVTIVWFSPRLSLPAPEAPCIRGSRDMDLAELS